MTMTVADIAAKALNGVAAKLSGVVHACVVSRETDGVFDPETGTFTSETVTDTGRIVFDNQTPPADLFPDYVPGPGEELAYIEGLTVLAPKEGDALTFDGKTFAILKSSDLLHAGAFYPVIVRGQA